LAVITVALVSPGPMTGWRSVAGAAPSACVEGVNQCVTLTPPACTGTCPTATVGPTLDVGDDAYVYVSVAGFPAGDWLAVDFCPASQSDPADPVCAYAPADFAGIDFVPAEIKLLPDGTGVLSYQVTADPPGQGEAAIPGLDVDENESTLTPFYCDNSANPCDLQITDLGQTAPYGTKPLFPAVTGSNTITVPLTFAAASTGCPASDPVVDTVGSFSIEQFLPTAVEASCGGPNGVIGLNISTDSETAVSEYAQGDTSLAFTDDPDDPAEQSALQGTQSMLIPVAASASVVAFLSATSQETGGSYAASTEAEYNLTPNMVAGIITSAYSNTDDNDVLVPPLTCKELGCKNSQSGMASSFNLLNPTPTHFTGPGSILSSFSSVATGASDETTGWLCSMPNVTLAVKTPGGKTVDALDDNVAATTLETDATGVTPWPFSTCANYPVIPTVGTAAGTYQPAQSPANQAAKIRNEWSDGGGPDPYLYGPQGAAGFGAMDWGDAAFFGLDAANLQNASGDFVAPSEASIDAALDDATVLGNGTLSYDYATTDPTAYPTPMVTYAVLSTAPQPADQVAAETDLLTNIVNFSHSPSGVSLPAGYVPLPDNLYTQATNDIKTALSTIVETSSSSTPPAASTGTTGSAASTGSGPGAGSASTSGTPGASDAGLILHAESRAGLGGAAPAASAHHRPAPPTTHTDPGFAPRIVAALTGRDRWILPILLGAMVLSLPSGSIVLVVGRLRRRVSRRRATSPEPTT
jgi:hypothetical protein